MVFPLRRADGVFRSFLTRVEPLKDSEGRVVRWFGTNTDITERKQAEKEVLRNAMERKAMEEALFLTRFATKVTLLHRRESFRASKIMLERAMAHPNIALRTNTVVEEVLGVEDHEVRGVRLKDVTSGVEDELKISGLFLGIGHIPNARAFHGQMDLDEEGYIKTKDNVLTTHNGTVIPGVYACGDVQDRRYRQAITAAGSGCMAALEAEKYLEERGH